MYIKLIKFSDEWGYFSSLIYSHLFTNSIFTMRQRRAPCDHCPWCIGPHCTGTPTLPQQTRGLDTALPTPKSKPQPSWRPVQTCSLQESPKYWHWRLVANEADTVNASGRYVSKWNIFLLNGHQKNDGVERWLYVCTKNLMLMFNRLYTVLYDSYWIWEWYMDEGILEYSS